MADREVSTPFSQTSGPRGGGSQGDGTGKGRSNKAAANPFKMPADEEVFAVRDQERRKKEEQRRKQLELPVHEKGTYHSRAFANTAEFIKSVDSRAITKNAPRTKTGLPPSGDSASQARRRDRENMSEFITKKREMFLVQMSLDTKRSEIRKLEDQAQQREEALKKSETMLEEDAARFDAFLKENDYKAVTAMREAEQETKKKQDTVSELKKLTAQIAAVKADMLRFEEQLEDCRRYKSFLDKVSPEDWLAEQQKKQEALKKQRKEQQNESSQQLDGLDDDWMDEPALFFESPQQLLDIFAGLEERNLFLIQNSQETEEALEELRQRLEDTRSRMGSDKASLQGQIDSLLAAVDAEQSRASHAGVRAQPLVQAPVPGIDAPSEDTSAVLAELHKRVADMYQACGFDADASLGTLQMLANVESRLEENLATVAKLPPTYVEEAEKAKEKERRQKAREEKLELQRKQQEERVQRSIARAQAPAPKKTGKPVMFRAPPIQQRTKKVEQTEANDSDEDIKEFFTE